MTTTVVAWAGLVLAILALFLQWWTWRHQPEKEVETLRATRRWNEEEAALKHLRALIPSVVSMCGRFIEQFPEGASERFTIKAEIGGRKVAERLGHFREEWRKKEGAIRTPAVLEAYREIGIERSLSRLLSGAEDQILLPEVKAVHSSLEALARAIDQRLA